MKKRPITIIAVTILILGGIIFFLIKPVASSILKSYQDLETSRQNLQNTEQTKQIIQDLKNNVQLKNVSDIALKYIPKESEQSDLVLELTAIAQKNNLTIDQTSITPQKTQSAPKTSQDDTSTAKALPAPSSTTTASSSQVSELQFTMSLTGAYGDFINFLQSTETSSRLIMIKTINITKSTTQSADQTPRSAFGFQLTGAAFYKTDVTIAKNQDNLKVSDETIKKFLNLKSYSLPINLKTEAGFGRVNPFDNY